MNTPTLTLSDGAEIPQIGLGTWELRGEEAYRVVRDAIEVGYRLIDTATLYNNEAEVGRAINDAIKAGDVTRDDVVVTSKVWDSDHGADSTKKAFQQTLSLMQLDYLDVYLIHSPVPGSNVETFEAMAQLQGLGSIQSIGVSNFYPSVLEELIDKTGIVPAINQVELHPGFSQAELRKLHQKLGIVTQAWAPFGGGDLFDHPVILEVARRHKVASSVIILSWMVAIGCVAIPKTAQKERLLLNLKVHDFRLSDDDVSKITAIDNESGAGRKFWDPKPVGR